MPYNVPMPGRPQISAEAYLSPFERVLADAPKIVSGAMQGYEYGRKINARDAASKLIDAKMAGMEAAGTPMPGRYAQPGGYIHPGGADMGEALADLAVAGHSFMLDYNGDLGALQAKGVAETDARAALYSSYQERYAHDGKSLMEKHPQLNAEAFPQRFAATPYNQPVLDKGVMDALRAYAKVAEPEDALRLITSMENSALERGVKALDYEKARLEIEKLKNPDTYEDVTTSDGRLAQKNKRTGQLSNIRDPLKEEGFTLSPGQSRHDAKGNLVANVPAKDEGFSLTPGQKRFNSKGEEIASAPGKPEKTTMADIKAKATAKWLERGDAALSDQERRLLKDELADPLYKNAVDIVKNSLDTVGKDAAAITDKVESVYQGLRNKRGARPEGQTATNPKTGERIVYRGGKWVSLN